MTTLSLAPSSWPSAGIHTEPLPHQLKGIEFIVQKEESSPYGGLLADAMGLGKTYQMIASVMLTRHLASTPPTSPTLVVVPKGLLLQWRDEILHHTTLEPHQVLIYHGAMRKGVSRRVTADTVFVLSTYHTTVQDYIFPETPHATKRRKWSDTDRVPYAQMGWVFRKVWHRVILDEAHLIRNAASKLARACVELRAKYRWCLTGTAFNNHAGDLATLSDFLQLEPTRPLSESCRHRGWWERATPSVVQAWRDQHMLRRTKDILHLPSLTEEEQVVPVTAEEEKLYLGIIVQMQADYREFLRASGVEKTRLFRCMLVWLLRLRQVCNDPLLVLGRHTILPYARLAQGRAKIKVKQCNRCEAALSTSHKMECGHVACEDCASQPCVFCGFRDQEHPSFAEPSSKTRAVLQQVQVLLKEDPSRKIIIYSQWTAYLDRLEGSLTESKITYTRLDGDITSIEERAQLISTFQQPDTSVLLASLHAGGLGLNLTAASAVIFCDAWYNPQVEIQARDRAHRLGQTRAVQVFFLRSALSIERKVVEIQQDKLRSAEYYLDSQGDDASPPKRGAGINMTELRQIVEGISPPTRTPQKSLLMPSSTPTLFATRTTSPSLSSSSSSSSSSPSPFSFLALLKSSSQASSSSSTPPPNMLPLLNRKRLARFSNSE